MTSHQTYADDCKAAFKIVDLATLKALIENASAEVDRRSQQEKQETIQKIRDMAAQAGLSKHDLLEIANGKKATKPINAKYQHPTIPNVTWSGMGKRPKWVAQHMEEHGNIDALKIAA